VAIREKARSAVDGGVASMRNGRLVSLAVLAALAGGCYGSGYYYRRYPAQRGYYSYYRRPVAVVAPPPVYVPPPVYPAPAPVYTAPAPVYAPPPPVYSAPAPAYGAPPAYQGTPGVYFPAGQLPLGAIQGVMVTAQDGRQFTLSPSDLQALADGQVRLNVPPGVTGGTLTVWIAGRPLTLPFALHGPGVAPGYAPAQPPPIYAPAPAPTYAPAPASGPYY
jgi:hypothetical protein